MTGRRRAVIVANDEYEHEGLRRLRAPSADAQALARVLGDADVGGFDVAVVLNAPAHEVAARVEDLFSDAQSDDLLLLHFSCHGLKNEAGELFFAARNTRPDRLGSTAVAADFVQRCMGACRARRVVLFLDCCYGGAFGRGVTVRGSGSANVLDSFPRDKLGGGRGRAVISASSAMEYAFEGERLAEDRQQPSAFTAAVVNGLESGEADRDQDGLVSLNELYDYVFDAVRSRNPHQTPTRDVEMQGEVYLARSRTRKLVPSPLPAAVQDALKDPNMFTRLGAVTELSGRLRGADTAAALAAHMALTELARGDISYVADAAEEAIQTVSLRVAEQELDFGTLRAGGPVTPRTLHLHGHPLARVATVEASEPWINVTPVEEGFEVRIDPSSPRLVRATCTVVGPTGRRVVPVRALVVSAEEPVPSLTRGPERTPGAATDSASVSGARAANVISGAREADAPGQAEGAAQPVHDPIPLYRRLSVAGWLSVAAGVLLIASLFLPFRYGEPATTKAADLTWYTVLLGGLAVGAGGCLSFAATAGRRLGPGLVVATGSIAVWGLADLAGLAREAALDGLDVGFGFAVTGDLAAVLAAVLALTRLRPALAPLHRPAREDRVSWLMIVLGAAGALTMAATASTVWFPAADAGFPWYGAQTVYVGLLALCLPLAAAAGNAVHGFALMAGWFLGGLGLVCQYWVILGKADADRSGLLAFAVTLPLLMVFAAMRAFGAESAQTPVEAPTAAA